MTELLPINKHRAARLTIEDFLLLNDGGAFDGYARSELLDGTIYVMNAEYRAHVVAKSRLLVRLGNLLEKLDCGLEAVAEPSIAMPPANMPQPDIAIVRIDEAERSYTMASLKFLIEVSDSTIRFDLGKKARIYAANGVAEYWVVDVRKGLLHQFSAPERGTYLQSVVHSLGDPVTSVTVPGLTVATDRLS